MYFLDDIPKGPQMLQGGGGLLRRRAHVGPLPPRIARSWSQPYRFDFPPSSAVQMDAGGVKNVAILLIARGNAPRRTRRDLEMNFYQYLNPPVDNQAFTLITIYSMKSTTVALL